MDISQYYQFNAIDDNTSVIVRRGDGIPKIISGGARWKTTARPKRVSVVTFDGSDPYKIDIPVLFDGWATNDSIENAIATLNQMKFSRASLTRPTRVRIDGALPVKSGTWVIEDITWGDNVIWQESNGKGLRYRQDAVVHLLQYVPEVTLKGIKVPTLNDKIITIKSGQTIKDLAGGDPKKAKAIQKANGIRDPKTVRPGDKVRIKGDHGGGH